MSQDAIARRVAESIPATTTHAQVAAQIGLSEEKLSKSLRGQRAFSSVELAQLADVLNVGVRWLITGRPDPHRLVVTARHDYHHATGERDVPGRTDDQRVINDVHLAYRQAFAAWNPAVCTLPAEVHSIRAALGPDFARDFADRLESALDVDVIRVAEVSTAHSFRVGTRKVIVLPATGNWFRENWSLAHELGHLVADHHAENLSRAEWDSHEAIADAFAAELLLPAREVYNVDWDALALPELGDLVWAFGVSTDTLRRRLGRLNIEVPAPISEALALNTPKLLRRHWTGQHPDAVRQIAARIDQAATRRFPIKLQNAHTDLIADGALHKCTLAWMLGINADALEVDVPPPPESVDPDQLAPALEL